MEFKDLVRDIENYLHIQGTKANAMIKSFVNDSILDFARLDEWEKLQTAAVITLDDSDTYDLTTILVNDDPFFAELELIDENGGNYDKLDYKTYLIAKNKAYYWVIWGNTLYVIGTGLDINLLYKSLGVKYPLTKDADEIPATIFYSDAIKQMTIVKFLKWLGDTGDNQFQLEEREMNIKLNSIRKHENRIRKQGKPHIIHRS